MSCHEYAKFVPTHPWRGAMTVPRELSLRRHAERGWDLLQTPVTSLQSMRGEAMQFEVISLSSAHGAHPLPAVGRALELQCRIAETTAQQFGLLLSSDSGDQVSLGYDSVKGCVFIDRGQCCFQPPGHAWYAARREAAYPAPNAAQPLRLRVLVDAASVELFVGDGELVMTEQIFCGNGAEPYRVSLFSDEGDTRFEGLRLWPLKSMHAADDSDRAA
jgi:sucrose-6-phosphate hydrolase SacC (GH32 family)